MVQQDSRRPPRSRAGWVVLLCLATATLAGIVLFAAAWIVGGRVQAGSLTERILPADEQRIQGDGGRGSEGSAAPVLHELPVDQLSQLKPLGWNVAHLSGYGLEPQQVETELADGLRTVEVRLSNGQSVVEVAETRPEEESAELAPLQEQISQAVDLGAAEQEEIEVSTGDTGDLYRTEGSEEWTVAVETDYARYVITSDMTEASAEEIAAWVLVTDRSRLQIMPSEETGGLDRIERGLREILSW